MVGEGAPEEQPRIVARACVRPRDPLGAGLLLAARVPGADVRAGRAEELPFSSDTFDAALAQLVVQLMDDRDAGVAEMIRVTRPGGVLAACVWDSTTMPLLRAFWDAALDVAPERAGAIYDGRRVGYRDDADLAEPWEAHGLVDVTTGELWVKASYVSFDDCSRRSPPAPDTRAPATRRWTA